MPDLNDQLDDADDAGAQGALAPAPLDARALLGQEALFHALTRRSRLLLSQPARVLILHVPTDDWVELIAEAIPKIAGAIVIKTATEVTVSQKVAHRVGGDTLRYLHSRRSIVSSRRIQMPFLMRPCWPRPMPALSFRRRRRHCCARSSRVSARERLVA